MVGVTPCSSCGDRLSRAREARVYVPPSGDVALLLCARCSTLKASSRLYVPASLPRASRTDLSSRGVAR